MTNDKHNSSFRRHFLRQAGAFFMTGAAGLIEWEKITIASTALDSNQAFTLTQKGAPTAVILTPENPTKNTITAANDLNYWVKRISGASLKIVSAANWNQKLPLLQ